MEDMRCFQHFMLQCYPHHPLGNEDVWTHEVPCLSRSVSSPPFPCLLTSFLRSPSLSKSSQSTNTSCTQS